MISEDSLFVDDGPVFPEDQDLGPRKLDFLGYLPCAVRAQYRQALWSFIKRQTWGEGFKWYVPGGCGGQDVYDGLWQKPLQDFPPLLSSLGFGDFFQPEFELRARESGLWQNPLKGPIHSAFENQGFRDPLGFYGIWAVFPYVILIDKEQLGTRPEPKTWKDLSDPIYFKDLICGDHDDEVSAILLLYTFQTQGIEGVKALAKNIRGVWHSARMTKTAGSGNPDGAALYVLPWFFAQTCPNRQKVKVLWPQEGALTSPLYILARNNLSPQDQTVLDYLTGSEMGKICTEVNYPFASVSGPLGLEQNQKLKWLGWDFIRSYNLSKLTLDLQALVKQEIQPASLRVIP